MSDMTTEEILAKATPRPWGEHWHTSIAKVCKVLNGKAGMFKEADSELIALAVDSIEKQRECISGLITEARQVINTFWETYEYRDKYTDNDCTKALEHLEAALARAEELLK